MIRLEEKNAKTFVSDEAWAQAVKDAEAADRIRQFFQRLFLKLFPGLAPVGIHLRQAEHLNLTLICRHRPGRSSAGGARSSFPWLYGSTLSRLCGNTFS